MRAGAARGHVGNLHEVGFYSSDAEFRALILPFAEEGIAAREPVIIGYDERKNGLLRSWLPDPSAVEFIADDSLYATPGRAITTYQRLFEFHQAMGAVQIRIAGDVPHPGNGRRFDGWDRYECAINTVWQDIPVWSRCLYDATTAPAVVLDSAERTHPFIVAPSGAHRPSARYQGVSGFLGVAIAPDPLEQSAPVVKLTDNSAAAARHALTLIGRGRVSGQVFDDLLLAMSEAINNAWRHGRPPVTVRIWATPDRIVVKVHDTGSGPDDPLAGLIPPVGGAPGPGLGLWLAHQLDTDIALMREGHGFTVRLRTDMGTG